MTTLAKAHAARTQFFLSYMSWVNLDSNTCINGIMYSSPNPNPNPKSVKGEPKPNPKPNPNPNPNPKT